MYAVYFNDGSQLSIPMTRDDAVAFRDKVNGMAGQKVCFISLIEE